MSAREQVLMKIIANLRRFGIDISNSKFKDKDIEIAKSVMPDIR